MLTLRPGAVTLAEWRAVLAGTPVTLDPACRSAVRASAEAIRTIVAENRTVYGVNTGFGKLASTRIAKGDLEATGTDEGSMAKDRRVQFIWQQPQP